MNDRGMTDENLNCFGKSSQLKDVQVGNVGYGRENCRQVLFQKISRHMIKVTEGAGWLRYKLANVFFSSETK